jgi:hypothetical protein
MKFILLSGALMACIITHGQKNSAVINAKEVEQIEKVLSSDDMSGREAGKASGQKAADFIAGEFKRAGLQPWDKATNYLQPFELTDAILLEVKGEINDEELKAENIFVFTTKPELEVNEKSGYQYKTIQAGASLLRSAYSILQEKRKTIVFVDESFATSFSRLSRLKQPILASDASVVFILSNKITPEKLKIKVKHSINLLPASNVVGILPGKTKPNEYVIFSAHYDHLGIGKAVEGDSIYNGANDDASGITAVIMLARYFKQLNNNARTLVFAAFSAEELGGLGSQVFSKQFNPKQVMAMFNIEMIGTESKWGKNSAYITGFEKTDMGEILQKNLKGTSFTFYPDPYTEQKLFYRSDNATLARLGVPAHTISTSKMDSEKYYHTVNDEIETLDLDNMAAIIKSIAESSKTIVAGKDTPTRVDASELD